MRIYFKCIFRPDYQKNPSCSILHLIIWVAAVSIALILTLYGFSTHRTISNEIIRDAKETSIKVSKALFEQQKSTLTKSDENGNLRLDMDQSHFLQVDHHFRQFLKNFDIHKIKIYDTSGRIVYSTESKLIGRTDTGNKRLSRALSGEIDTHLVKKEMMLDLADEARFNVEIVETYVPIKIGDKVVGSFETYSDVTPYRQEISSIVFRMLSSLTVILLMVFASSFLIIKKASNLLKSAQLELANKVDQLEQALVNVKQLEGIIPICMHCKKIRDDEESWHQLERYISQHSEAHFSHGICPECFEIEITKYNGNGENGKPSQPDLFQALNDEGFVDAVTVEPGIVEYRETDFKP